MIDLTSTAKTDTQATSESIAKIIDEALVQFNENKTRKRYANRPKSLGMGRIGHPLASGYAASGCERALYMEWKQFPEDEGRAFGANLYRIFDMGHDGEERMAQYFRMAGFDLKTEDKNGQQFGIEKFPDPETGVPRMRGFADGVFIDGPKALGSVPLVYPFLWENKALNDKKWKEMVSKGVETSHPVYYGQMQLYMGCLNLTESPGLLTAMNRNTGEVHYEFVQYNEEHAQAGIDRAIRVLSGKDPLDFPRVTNDYNQLPCKWCNHRLTCMKLEENKPAPQLEGPDFWPS